VNWLNERWRRWLRLTDSISLEEMARDLEAEKIEEEDLAAFLVRCARQPGHGAISMVLVGERREGTEKPTLGTWAVIWWN